MSTTPTTTTTPTTPTTTIPTSSLILSRSFATIIKNNNSPPLTPPTPPTPPSPPIPPPPTLGLYLNALVREFFIIGTPVVFLGWYFLGYFPQSQTMAAFMKSEWSTSLFEVLPFASNPMVLGTVATGLMVVGGYAVSSSSFFNKRSRRINDGAKYGKRWVVPTALLCVLLTVFSEIVLSVFVDQKEEPELLILGLAGDTAERVCAIIIAPFTEELFFRGLIFHRLYMACGPITAFLSSSLLFGFSHSSAEANKVATTTLGGLSFCIAYYATGKLVTSFLTHALANSLFVVVMGLSSPTPMTIPFLKQKIENHPEALNPEDELRCKRLYNMMIATSMEATVLNFQAKVRSALRGVGVPIYSAELFDNNDQPTPELRRITDALWDNVSPNNDHEIGSQAFGNFLMQYTPMADLLFAAANVIAREVITEKARGGDHTAQSILLPHRLSLPPPRPPTTPLPSFPPSPTLPVAPPPPPPPSSIDPSSSSSSSPPPPAATMMNINSTSSLSARHKLPDYIQTEVDKRVAEYTTDVVFCAIANHYLPFFPDGNETLTRQQWETVFHMVAKREPLFIKRVDEFLKVTSPNK